MRLTFLAFAVASGLAACDELPPATSTPAPVAAPVTKAAAPVATLPREARSIARDFVNVVEQVEPVAERECRSRAPRMNCDFLIVVDDSPGMPPNAFQTVDDSGRPVIAFTLALIQDAQNADELAFVMAHEAAHHIEGHLEQQRRNAILGATGFARAASQLGADPETVRVAQELGAAVGIRTFSKDYELEADRLGAKIAYMAGYDPLMGAQFFFRVPDPGDQFLSTHPANQDRFDAVQEVASRL